jgi:uncharacterized protein
LSQENVETVRRLHEAINAGDEATVFELLDPEIVWVQSPIVPDARTFHGHAGVRELVAMLDDAFEDIRMEADTLLDGGDSVVVLGHMRARGKGSGVEIREPRAWLWSLRDGTIVRHQTFNDRVAALEAAGLEE